MSLQRGQQDNAQEPAAARTSPEPPNLIASRDTTQAHTRLHKRHTRPHRDAIRVLEVLEATVGGTRKHLVLLIRGLDKTEFDVEVACPDVRHGTTADTSFVADIGALGVTVHRIDMRRELHPLADARALWQLLTLIGRREYDIIHCHSSKAGFLGRIAGKLAGVSTVYTPNGFYFLDVKHRGRRHFYTWLERLAGLLTDRLIAVSHSEMQVAIAESIAPRAKTVVIPNAIDSQSLCPDPSRRAKVRRALGIGDSTPVVGTVARFTNQKDPLSMVRAMKLILQDVPDAVLVWCGEGELRAEVEALAHQLGIASSARFLGFRTDVEDIMRSYDVFLLTSIFEGLPYTVLEAMSMSIPVVVTNVVGNRDVVVDGQTGILVPPQQPAMAAKAVVSLIRDRDTRELMGRNARMRVREHFSLETLAGAVAEVYHELVCLR